MKNPSWTSWNAKSEHGLPGLPDLAADLAAFRFRMVSLLGLRTSQHRCKCADRSQGAAPGHSAIARGSGSMPGSAMAGNRVGKKVWERKFMKLECFE